MKGEFNVCTRSDLSEFPEQVSINNILDEDFTNVSHNADSIFQFGRERAKGDSKLFPVGLMFAFHEPTFDNFRLNDSWRYLGLRAFNNPEVFGCMFYFVWCNDNGEELELELTLF